MALVMKRLLENKHLENGDYFVIIASCPHPLLLTEHAANWLVETALEIDIGNEIFTVMGLRRR